jgi:hypothetical protein
MHGAGQRHTEGKVGAARQTEQRAGGMTGGCSDAMELSRGTVADLGGGTQRERWWLRDGRDDINGTWHGRPAPRRHGECQSNTVAVEPWTTVTARSWWSTVTQRSRRGGLDERIRLAAYG